MVPLGALSFLGLEGEKMTQRFGSAGGRVLRRCASRALIASLMVLCAPALFAGGYLNVTSGGVADKWSGTVNVRFDTGNLSATQTDPTDDTNVLAALNLWSTSSISTC